MVDLVLLHAAGDADRAAGLAAAIPDGLVVTMPVDAASPPALGAGMVRVVVWSRAAVAVGAALSAAVAGGPAVIVAFDPTPVPEGFAGQAPVLPADADAWATAELVIAAARLAGRERASAVAASRAYLRFGRTDRPQRRASTQTAARRLAAASTVGVGASLLGVFGVAAFTAPQATPALRVGEVAVAQDRAVYAPGAVRASLLEQTLVRAESFALAAPAQDHEIALRAEARINAHRPEVDAQVARVRAIVLAESAPAAAPARLAEAAPVAPKAGVQLAEAAPPAKPSPRAVAALDVAAVELTMIESDAAGLGEWALAAELVPADPAAWVLAAAPAIPVS